MSKIKVKVQEDIDDVNKAINYYENDKDALHHLRDIIGDEYPEIDLTTMGLHEAVDLFEEIRSTKKKPSDKAKISSLMGELDEFLDKSKAPKKVSRKKRKTKRKTTKRRKK